MDFTHLAGIPIRVVESPLCERTVPIKQHRRRRGQSASYHRRVQKKWTKRFGTRIERSAFIMDGRLLGLGLRPMLAVPQGMLIEIRDLAR